MSEIPQKAVQAAVEALNKVHCTHTLGWSCAECRARVALEAAMEVLTPSEMIRRLMPSAKWGNPEWPKVLDVLAEEGLVVVSTEDLRAYTYRGVDMTEEERAAMNRLRAALPEETTDA